MTTGIEDSPMDDPQSYLAELTGWRRRTVDTLRATVLSAGPLDERIAWGHLVYAANGPALLIRAEEARVLFGIWRGRGLRDIEPRLKPGGRYDMATMIFLEGDAVEAAIVARLVREAVRLNAELGDPTRPV